MRFIGSSEERSGAEKARRIMGYTLASLAAAAAVGIGSILLVCFLFPGTKAAFRFTDGYYNIYSAYDYNRYWKMVREQPGLKGRLMNDIYLNDITDFESWRSRPPKNKITRADSFEGVFDGNGHTVYGLYSVYGYGLVKENWGEIYNLSIRKSLVGGDSNIGGICQRNVSTISGCVFGGKVVSNKTGSTGVRQMAGICTTNSGKIKDSGFEGILTAEPEQTQGQACKGERAGICTNNRGEISRCYNLSYNNQAQGGGHAISDGGEKDCIARRDAGWEIPDNSQTMLIEGEQVWYLSALMDKDIYQLYWEKQHLPECVRQVGNMKLQLETSAKEEETLWQEEGQTIFSEFIQKAQGHNWRLISGIEDGQAVKDGIIWEALGDEQINRFIREAVSMAGTDWPSLELEALGGGNAPVTVRLTMGEEKVKIARYPLPVSCTGSRISTKTQPLRNNGSLRKTEEISYEEIWEVCGGILGEPDEESWEHYTWQILYEPDKEKTTGTFVLYGMEQAAGFFYMKDGVLYQAETETPFAERAIKDIKRRIWEYDEEEPERMEVVLNKPMNSEIWEGMLWTLWNDRLPGDGFDWSSNDIREAVHRQLTGSSTDMPSMEDILKVEELSWQNGREKEGLEDLSKFPKLKSLSVSNWGNGQIDFTNLGEKAPGLEELYVDNVAVQSADFFQRLPHLTTLCMTYCQIQDISFVRNLPNLTEVSFYGNQIQDISPLADLKKLHTLSVAFNEVEDISPLAELKELEFAGLQGNRIASIEPLKSLKNLKKLNLDANQISDLSPLAEMTGLTALGVAANQIKDITPLKGMTHLYNLALDANEISDITPLKGMTEMEYLGLGQNLIEDYTPVMEMENLYSLSVYDNPGQDIGKLVFTPWLSMGRKPEEEERKEAQGYLRQYCALTEQDAETEDVAKGDINGDGTEDIAITCLVNCPEESEQPFERYVYLLIGQQQGGFRVMRPLQILSPEMGGVFGDPYQGIIITDRMLAVQVYGGSNWRWGETDIYEYEKGELVKKWQVMIGHFVFNSGLHCTVYDYENECWEDYVYTGEEEEHREKLLINKDNPVTDWAKDSLNKKLKEIEEKTKISMPEMEGYEVKPVIDGYYDYHILDYPVKKNPDAVLKETAEGFFEEAVSVPVIHYFSEEVKETYDKLTGVELPEVFYAALEGEEPVLLYYSQCEPAPEGGYIHKIQVCRPDEEGTCWEWAYDISYYEDSDTFVRRGE